MEHGAIFTHTKDPSSSGHHNNKSPLIKIIFVSSIAAGVQFGWALQLSLLTPYVQLLGVPHTWSGFIWLCGPISGLLVQPIVGYYSDRCTSKFGRRRPYIVSGTVLVSISIILIGFAADFGKLIGDKMDKPTKPRAVGLFVVGFWILDVANNMLQGPCRALLADLSGNDHRRMRVSNAFYSFFMAVGNVLGYAAGSYTYLYKILPFTMTSACDMYCANLKTCFIFSICLLIFVTILACATVHEIPLEVNSSSDSDDAGKGGIPFFGEMFAAFKNLSRPMWILLLVTCFNWIAWFPFLLYDTDWMGKEVYGGEVKGNAEQAKLYDLGVRAGSLGLMVNSIVLGFSSLAVEPLSKLLRGGKRLWGIVNFILAICLALTVLVTKMAEKERQGAATLVQPSSKIKAYALSLFGVLGIPQAITYSIPFALASIFCSNSGAGQGLSLGVMNLAIVIPQMVVSVLSGPVDELFGGGNLPAFVMGAIAATISGVLALFVLPSPQPQSGQQQEEPSVSNSSQNKD